MNPTHPKSGRQTALALCSVAVLLLFGNAPVIGGLSQDANFLVGTFLVSLLLWLTVGFGWPSLLCIACVGLNASIGLPTALQTSFGSSSFVFLLFTFLCTYALVQTDFISRVSMAFIQSKQAQKGPFQFALQLFFAALLLGCFISPSVLFFTMFPIVKGIYQQLGLKKGDPYASFLLVGLVGTVSIASGMTPISHAFPVAALAVFESFTGTAISYVTYMLIAVPAGLCLFSIFIFLLHLFFRPKRYHLTTESVLQNQSLPAPDMREKSILGVFIGVVLLWVLPSILKQVFAGDLFIFGRLGTALPPMFGVIIMNLVHVDGKPLLDLKAGFSQGISWPTLLMSASASALAAALTNPALGIQDYLTDIMLPYVSSLSPFFLLCIFLVWGAVQSNATAHLLTAQLVTTIALPILQLNAPLSLAVIVPMLSFVSSVGFAMPSAMPYIAEAQSSGWTNAQDIRRVGLPMIPATLLCSICIAYPIAAMLQ